MSEVSEPWTVLRLIRWTRDYLDQAGVDTPRLAAEVLLADVLGCERIELYTRYDRVVDSAGRAAYRDAVRRAAAGEPISYIRGFKEFYSLTFKVTPAVLIPRPETELLVDQAVEFARSGPAGLRLWDACTGSGCVAVAAGRFAEGYAEVLATDLSPDALAVAAENVSRHGLDRRVRLAEADLLDLPGELAEQSPFDVITANPPYVTDEQMEQLPAPVRAEPELALRAGADGLDAVRRIVVAAADRLKPGGLLAMEIGAGQADAVYELLGRSKRYEGIRFVKDLAGIDRVAAARAVG